MITNAHYSPVALRRALPMAVALSLAPLQRNGGPCHHCLRTLFGPPTIPTMPKIPTAKAVSPRELLRPAAPPTAADARPFGSLNRNNRAVNYVNVNATAVSTSTVTPQPPITAAAPPVTAAAEVPLYKSTKYQPQPMAVSKLTRTHTYATRAAPSATNTPQAPEGRHANAAVAQARTRVAEAETKRHDEAANRPPEPPRSPNVTQVYNEHCQIGWAQEDFYRVVADVEQYAEFLPWCLKSTVHSTRRIQVKNPDPAAASGDMVDAIEMKATLVIGFSFLKEEYTSRVILIPSHSITAVLFDEETEHLLEERHAEPAGDNYFTSFFKKAKLSAKKSILKHLRCDWQFREVPHKKNEVEVIFSVSFEFKNPMHSKLIMNNIVVLMTRCFERRCESLYGPPSVMKQRLPAI